MRLVAIRWRTSREYSSEIILDQPNCDLGTVAQFFFTPGLAYEENLERLTGCYRRKWQQVKHAAENWQRATMRAMNWSSVSRLPT
jgi:hypothetical protein